MYCVKYVANHCEIPKISIWDTMHDYDWLTKVGKELGFQKQNWRARFVRREIHQQTGAQVLYAGYLGLIPRTTQSPKHCWEQPLSNELEVVLKNHGRSPKTNPQNYRNSLNLV